MRKEYVIKTTEDLKFWRENIEYTEKTYTGFERALSLCLINLYFSGHRKTQFIND